MTLPEKIKIIGLAVFFSFFLGHYTLATEQHLFGQSTSSSNQFGDGNGFRYVGQKFNATYNNLYSVEFNFFNVGNSLNCGSISVCSGVPNNTSQADIATNGMSCSWPGNSLLLHENFNLISTSTTKHIFSTPVPLTMGNDYYIMIDNGTAAACNKYISTWTVGSGRIIDNGQWPESMAAEGFYNDIIPIYLEAIYPNKPASGDTVFANDNEVDFFGTYLNDVSNKLQLTIYDNNNLPLIKYIDLFQSISTPHAYNFSVPLVAGNYTYKLDLYHDTSVSTSTIDRGLIDFTFDALHIATSTQSFNMPFNLSIDTVCNGIATSTIMGGIECGFKRVIYWSFFPSQSSLTGLLSSYDQLKASFPFSAFFDLTDTINEAIATTTPNMVGTIDIPFVNQSGDFIMLPVVSSTSLPNLIGATNNTLFRNTITWILWLAAAFIVFITFKKI